MRRKDLVWTFLSFALLGVVLGLLGCVKYTPYTAVWPMSLQKDSLLAVTTCDLRGHPIILLNKDLVGQVPAWAWKHVIAHEMQHADDVRASRGGCVGAMKRYNSDPNYRLWLEIRGKCAEYLSMKADEMFAGTQGWDFLLIFTPVYQLYGRHITFEEFLNRIPCRPP